MLNEYLNKKKTGTGSREKATCFVQPFVAVKTVTGEDSDGKDYQIVHTSFQSTSSCNIQSVNGINSCQVLFSMFILKIYIIISIYVCLFIELLRFMQEQRRGEEVTKIQVWNRDE